MRRRHRQHRMGDFSRCRDPRRLSRRAAPGRCERSWATECVEPTPTPSPPASSSSAARAPPTRATATRREFVAALKSELPAALAQLTAQQHRPGRSSPSSHRPRAWRSTRITPKVLDAEGKTLTVREALALINQTLDEALAEQEGDFDADSRWALTWFEQSGFAEGEYGVAEQLSKSKNTSVAGMVEAGILESKRGKVRLLKPEELPADWDPASDPRLTRVGDRPPPDPRTRERWRRRRPRSSSPSSAPRPRSPASWPTASTRSANARSARPRRSPTTASSRAGRKSSASRRYVRAGPSERTIVGVACLQSLRESDDLQSATG